MLEITPNLAIQEDEVQLEFTRASGPGGQNVNKVASAVQLRFDVANSPTLPVGVKQRLINLAGSRVTDDGVLILTAREFRSQDRNRQAAIDRLVALLQQAAVKPKRRRKTKVPQTVKEKRLANKRRRSQIKQLRGKVERGGD
ncbi:MAG: alternative ribosome rescue aminoacyl-tRNA hydrolase ArfB [Anaerolineae bacterium]|nr:alternative ribosome rescue aminoacyl-tRNA hydrolase ArfB [Anaerolineae bacterium]